ncbi:MAG: hypothetical protein MRERV_64c014 [Mycoplasmataceae bacterium RV_VA103A]|nr:MAG: hypothetical protein MRERV_64c014 [Mycoplasmataceae bacterium RV_VA103A]
MLRCWRSWFCSRSFSSSSFNCLTRINSFSIYSEEFSLAISFSSLATSFAFSSLFCFIFFTSWKFS